MWSYHKATPAIRRHLRFQTASYALKRMSGSGARHVLSRVAAWPAGVGLEGGKRKGAAAAAGDVDATEPSLGPWAHPPHADTCPTRWPWDWPRCNFGTGKRGDRVNLGEASSPSAAKSTVGPFPPKYERENADSWNCDWIINYFVAKFIIYIIRNACLKIRYTSPWTLP